MTFSAILGVLLLFFLGNGCLALARHYATVATQGLYEDRELEILSYRPGPSDSSEDPLRIKGILHPEGIEIETDDHNVSLQSLSKSQSVIQMSPAEDDVVGKRVKVRYYVGKPEDRRMWTPSVHNSFSPSAEGLWRTQCLTIGSLFAVVACFYYSYRANLKYKQLTGDVSR